MTRVRISVDDDLLGDITVEHEDGLGSNMPDRQRRVIANLLSRSITRVHAAYEIGSGRNTDAD